MQKVFSVPWKAILCDIAVGMLSWRPGRSCAAPWWGNINLGPSATPSLIDFDRYRWGEKNPGCEEEGQTAEPTANQQW